MEISESYGGLSFLPQSFLVSIFVGEATRTSLRARPEGGGVSRGGFIPSPAGRIASFTNLSRMTPADVDRHKNSDRHARNLKKYGRTVGSRGPPPVIVCEEIEEYRQAALAVVEREDAVLEVGCCRARRSHGWVTPREICRLPAARPLLFQTHTY